MIITSVLFLAGFTALYFGAEWLVEGASDIAAHLKLSKSFVGLTLVAFGTSAPELFVNVIAAFRGETLLPLANIAGSNLTNLCVGFGLAALSSRLIIERRHFLTDLFFVFLTPCLVLGSFLLTSPPQLAYSMLVPFAILLLVYLYSLSGRSSAETAEDPTHLTMHKPVALFVLGVAALYLGGEVVFKAATDLASTAGIPESIIGLTIVACGTSIPDVTASVVAAKRGEFHIAVGNLLGSNISNVFVVLGGTLLASGMSLDADRPLMADYAAVCLVTLLFAAIATTRQRVGRVAGGTLLAVFIVYYAVRIGLALS